MAEQRSHTRMSPETLEALRGSIAKWEGIVAGTVQDEGPANCPLCIRFNRTVNERVNCSGCPVRDRTEQHGCTGSPYDDFENYMGLVEEGEEELDEARKKDLAQEELDFLKSLLPTDAIPDETETRAEK